MLAPKGKHGKSRRREHRRKRSEVGHRLFMLPLEGEHATRQATSPEDSRKSQTFPRNPMRIENRGNTSPGIRPVKRRITEPRTAAALAGQNSLNLGEDNGPRRLTPLFRGRRYGDAHDIVNQVLVFFPIGTLPDARKPSVLTFVPIDQLPDQDLKFSMIFLQCRHSDEFAVLGAFEPTDDGWATLSEGGVTMIRQTSITPLPIGIVQSPDHTGASFFGKRIQRQSPVVSNPIAIFCSVAIWPDRSIGVMWIHDGALLIENWLILHPKLRFQTPHDPTLDESCHLRRMDSDNKTGVHATRKSLFRPAPLRLVVRPPPFVQRAVNQLLKHPDLYMPSQYGSWRLHNMGHHLNLVCVKLNLKRHRITHHLFRVVHRPVGWHACPQRQAWEVATTRTLERPSEVGHRLFMLPLEGEHATHIRGRLPHSFARYFDAARPTP